MFIRMFICLFKRAANWSYILQILMLDVYSKSYQTSKMESFAKIVNSFYMLSSIFDKVLNKREDVFLRVFNRTTTKKFSKGSKSCIRQFAGLVLQVCFLSCLRRLSNIPLKGSKGFFYWPFMLNYDKLFFWERMGKEWSLVIHASFSSILIWVFFHCKWKFFSWHYFESWPIGQTTEGLRSKEYQKAKNIAQKQKSNAGVTHNATNKFLFILWNEHS